MARLTVRFHPDAIAETQRAADWYAIRSPIAAEAFVVEMDRVIDEIRVSPETWPPYRLDCRRRVLSRFPFSVVYRVAGDTVVIVAVIHDRKRPGYWEAR